MPCSHLLPTDLPDPLRVEDVHLTETVLLLARGIAADLAFDRLPILADALEDAGCDNFALLSHLRTDEPHRVDCWALRRLLRTTLMLPGDVPITFAYCPPGTFLMGSDHPEAHDDERPAHRVTLTKGFYAGIYPVTQEQWRAVMGSDPSHFWGDTLPVESVSWDDAQAFCAAVRGHSGCAVRLPTEAEWEYSARGGTTTPYYWGTELNGVQANCDGGNMEGMISMPGTYRETTTAVGLYADEFPHPWGLADVIGNVSEWCADWYDSGYYTHSPENDPECQDRKSDSRAYHGGSWCFPPVECRATFRVGEEPGNRYTYVGFRVAFTA